MPNKDEIKKVILDVAGNPESGVVKDLADAWATAIEKLDNSRGDDAKRNGASFTPSKETRTTKPEETR